MTETVQAGMQEALAPPHYEPFGWHQWPDEWWLSYQFRRALGETQEGGGAISECFQAASRMDPFDRDTWYREWLRVADRARERGDRAEADGRIFTAKASWLRAVDYYRSAEFWLAPDDPRRLPAFDRCEECFVKAGRYFNPPIEVVEVPYEGTSLPAYFLRSPKAATPQPVVISFGGLDSFKEELYFMVARGMLERGISCLLVDGPGQGGALRRKGLKTRYDYEVPVGAVIDYLEQRGDVDLGRIGLTGSSLGGYYAARAASREHRLAAAISHGGFWKFAELLAKRDESYGLAEHIKWVFGTDSLKNTLPIAEKFDLEGVVDDMRCPYLILHGENDMLINEHSAKLFSHCKAAGVDVTYVGLDEDATGAEHCQHDNPTLGIEIMADWMSEKLGIDGRQLL